MRGGRRGRRSAAILAVVLMMGLPLAALRLAPAARADDSPGANLAGLNATATATGLLASPLTPGLVGAGNVTTGNLVEAAVPYSTSSTSTGPSNSGLASPAYPGDIASQLGNLFNTFSPLPGPVQTALNDPVLARSDYPPQVSTGSSSTYRPPTGSAGGLITASSTSGPSGTTSDASLSQTVLPAALMSIGSSTTRTVTKLGPSTVQASAHTDIGRISLLGGAVVIAGVESDAFATSDASNGHQTSDLRIGHVTVAGQDAYIGADGIHLSGAGQGSTLVPTANEVLTALSQAGIEVRTVSATSQTDAASAQVTSGALRISFLDRHLPNPSGALPISAIGLDLDIGVASASADATALPPFDSSFASATGTAVADSTTATGGALTAAGSSGDLAGGVPHTSPPAPSPAVAAGPASPAAATSLPGGSGPRPPGAGPGTLAASQPARLLGAPVRVAWVVLAFLLSLVVAGPLLGYANWQLLKGRKY